MENRPALLLDPKPGVRLDLPGYGGYRTAVWP
jgi:hypothetical protein